MLCEGNCNTSLGNGPVICQNVLGKEFTAVLAKDSIGV